MSSDELTKEQAKQLHDAIAPAVRYLANLERRMNATKWPPGDPLYAKTRRAHDALHALMTALHYAACGVRPPSSLGVVDGKANAKQGLDVGSYSAIDIKSAD